MVGPRKDSTPDPDLKAQVQLAFDNLKRVLKAAGCSFNDVVDATLYLVDPEANQGPILESLRKAFPSGPFSNVTAVGVTGWQASNSKSK